MYNLILRYYSVVIVFALLFTSGCTQHAIAQQSSEEALIIGTWIPEGNPHSKLVFSSNNTAKKYIKNNELFKTYNWTIETTQSPSGLTHYELILTNIQNSNDVSEYLIDTLTEERMVLVYNTGIGMSRNTYLRE